MGDKNLNHHNSYSWSYYLSLHKMQQFILYYLQVFHKYPIMSGYFW